MQCASTSWTIALFVARLFGNVENLRGLCVPTCCSKFLPRNGYGFVTKNGKVFLKCCIGVLSNIHVGTGASSGVPIALLMMIFRREFDSAGDTSQRARCAAELRVQVISFSFWVAETRVGVLMARPMMIFRREFAERGCSSEEF